MTQTRKLGTQGLESPRSGSAAWGCPSSTATATTPSRSRRIHRALELGVNFLDTADMYGPHTNEELVGRAIARPPRRRSCSRPSSASCATRTIPQARGVNGKPGVRARRRARRRCSASASTTSTSTTSTASIRTRRSRTPSARWPSWSSEGKVRYLGLSEAGAGHAPPRARRAPDHARCRPSTRCGRATPRTSILAACRELGIGFVAYSPLGRGFLTGADQVARRSRRRTTTAATRRASRARTSSENLDARRARRASSPRDKGVHAGAARARVGAARRARTSCRSPAPSARASRGERRRASTSSSPPRTCERSTTRCPRPPGLRYPEAMMRA